jgi:MoaA/NifB/PqqE/SkfB family radical SAM enzyme
MTALASHVDGVLARTVTLTERVHRRWGAARLAGRVTQAIHFVARGVAYVWRNRRYLTAIKLLNMAAVNLQFFIKAERVIGRPYKMKIESTNICNTKCQLCPTGLGLEGRPKGSMSFEQFAGLVDRMRWHLFALDLSMWGDPLIVPDIFRMIRHAHDRSVWTYISSNLHAYKPDKGHGEELVRSGLDLLTCSLHGATQETFAIYQPGKRFDDAVAKVRHIIATRDRMGSATPAVQLNFVVTRRNEHEIEAFKLLAAELGCKAVFSSPSLNLRFVGQNRQLQPLGLAADVLEKKKREQVAAWLPSDPAYALKPYRDLLDGRPAHSEDYNGHKLFDCSWPWRMSVINWDGEVCTCCGNFDPKEDMGNVFASGNSFGKIWNGRKYRMARRSFKRRVDDDDARDNACATCPGYML